MKLYKIIRNFLIKLLLTFLSWLIFILDALQMLRKPFKEVEEKEKLIFKKNLPSFLYLFIYGTKIKILRIIAGIFLVFMIQKKNIFLFYKVYFNINLFWILDLLKNENIAIIAMLFVTFSLLFFSRKYVVSRNSVPLILKKE
jgi:hypothetical protein